MSAFRGWCTKLLEACLQRREQRVSTVRHMSDSRLEDVPPTRHHEGRGSIEIWNWSRGLDGGGGRVPVRYMGTKRHLAHRVRRIFDDLRPAGAVVDLFSGMGSVAEALASRWSVVTNDFLGFTSVFGRSRFLNGDRTPHEELLNTLQASYQAQEEELRHAYRVQVSAEKRALSGRRRDLVAYFSAAKHVGNCDSRFRAARKAERSSKLSEKYRLATVYFSAGYFSLQQAIQLDALRCAIDTNLSGADWDWATASWLASASSIINSPGHTAQFMKPTTAAMARRIQRSWARDARSLFEARLEDLSPVGTPSWRRGNGVSTKEALTFLKAPAAGDMGAVYADPPYTSDHYSRYYHVYETLYRYDFPACDGIGRYRDDRVITDFSMKTKVISAFEQLVEMVASLGVPLVLSYPDNGLLCEAGGDLKGMLAGSFSQVTVLSIPLEHSTMGASSGVSTKSATENIYVCAA